AVGAPRVATVQRLAIPGDFAGGLVGPQVAVRQVVPAPRKGIHRLDGAPLLARKKQEGVVEIRSSGSGEPGLQSRGRGEHAHKRTHRSNEDQPLIVYLRALGNPKLFMPKL